MVSLSPTVRPTQVWVCEDSAPARISMMGSRAWLIEAPGAFTLEMQRRIWSLTQLLQQWPTVESLIPGVTNLLVLFHRIPRDPKLTEQHLTECWRQATSLAVKGKHIDIPVCYGGEHATDLEAVCRHTGLSAQEIVRRHAGALYTVVAVGSAPGFGYLHGLDPQLATPRKTVPSLNMLKGTVTIGGPQTGLSALTGPNGWNAIGYAEMEMFNPHEAVPALMAPGDTVRFLVERSEL